MIKKYILWIWISIFWSIWFWYCFPDLISVVPWEAYNWDNIYVDDFDISYDLTFSKPVTYINKDLGVEYAFYRDQNWYLHFYVNQNYWRTDYTINSYILSDLSGHTNEITQTQFINYVNDHSIYKVDFYFWYTCQANYNNWTTFSIHFDNWNYIYFAWWICQWNNLYVTPWWWPKQSPTNWTIAGLETYKSPFTINWTNTNTNNNNICPTIWQLMRNMGENYNTWLCYNNTTYFNGTNFEQIEQENIFTIYNNNYQDYTNRISIYRNNCTNTNTIQACQNAFSGEYKKYSIISNAINSNVDEKKLRNYCNLWLNYDPNATTCVASWWWIKEKYTTEEMIQDITDNWIIPTPNASWINQNNVLNALNNCEEWNRECYINNRNFIESLWNIYWKITWLFKERNGVNGIIPSYILRITFLTILFTVIFKK